MRALARWIPPNVQLILALFAFSLFFVFSYFLMKSLLRKAMDRSKGMEVIIGMFIMYLAVMIIILYVLFFADLTTIY